MNVVSRQTYRRDVQDALDRFRITALLGPRQCGKTTLARAFSTSPNAYFDLEDPVDLAGLHVLRVVRAEPGEAFHWGTHGGAELDLLVVRGSRRLGFEFKYADAPRVTRGMRVVLDDLKLERLFVVYPGDQDYALDDRLAVVALRNVERVREWTEGARPA